MPIHTLLSSGDYEITEDSGIDIDPDTTLATRKRSGVFRGSLSSLYSTFRFGTTDEVPESQTRMFCAGPSNVRKIAGTASDPHYTFDVEHVGMHSYVNSTLSYQFRSQPLWSVREVSLPKEYPIEGGGGSNVFIAGGTPYLPSGAANDDPVVIHDYLPGFNVRGVMYSTIPPHPTHPYMTAYLATLSASGMMSLVTANTVNYGSNVYAGYNWCKGMPQGTTTSTNTIGRWFIGDINPERVYESVNGGDKIYVLNFPVRWLQRKLPV